MLRAVVFLLPVAAGVLAARVAADRFPPPSGPLSTVGWWIAVLAAATVALVLVERVARRLLPLAWLFRMSLLFPTRAPRRWNLARRIGSVHQLEAHLAEAREGGIADDATEAAQRIITLITALQAHDRRTRGHAERVRVYTDMLTDELRLPEADRDRLRWAALLHDIGKLAISAKLLNKSGKLDENEWHAFYRHPQQGARYCGPLLDWLGPWGDTIIQHHEKYGGGGYPAGLAGEEICLGARIVAVPDAYEVMTSPRAYKKAMTPKAARQELADCAGRQFDPAIVRAFLNLSIRRLQWVAGPAAWLAQLPFVQTPSKVSPSTASLGLGLTAIVALALGLGIGSPAVAPLSAAAGAGGEGGDTVQGATSPSGAAGPDDVTAPLGPSPDLAPDSGAEPDPGLDAGRPEDGPGTAAGPDGDGPIVVVLPGPDPAPSADPDEPDEPIVIIVPGPDPTDPIPEPSIAPTVAPTVTPTVEPEPTAPASATPTPAPTTAPTQDPGPIIVIIPPPEPTPSPSPSPTTAPAPSPTASPAPDPTVSPAPTASPAPDPTAPPAPTASPDPAPTPDASPTADAEPTLAPTPPLPPPPAPPVAVDDGAVVDRRDSTTIDVLANDGGDLDPGTLTVLTQPQHGTASVSGGAIVYQAQPGWSGTVAFTYQVCGLDGSCAAATVTVVVERSAPQEGTAPVSLPLLLGGAALGNAALRLRRRR